jgi:hypothetical protein
MMLRLTQPILVKCPLFLVRNHARDVNMALPIAFTYAHERAGLSQSLHFKCAKS